MTFILWLAVLGAVLLTLALTSSYLRWMPVTTSAVCLLLGIAIGPLGVDLLHLDIKGSARWMEHLTEVAVLFSLFVSGLKLRLPLRHRTWRIAFGLAGPVMLLTILGAGLLLHYLLDLSWGVSLLVGAILAPTDPVLAGLVQVNNAQDYDALRFGLSGEAGLNDGSAFPFVIFGLLFMQHGGFDGDWVGGWLLKNLVWAVPVGLLIGYWMGRGIGRVTLRLRLSVFAAGLGLRQAEVKSTGNAQTPAEHLAQPVVGHLEIEPEQALHGDVSHLKDTQIAAGVMMGDMLAFGSLVERAMEVFLVTVLGIVLVSHWEWRALAVAPLLFCVIRPASVFAMPWGRLLDRRQRSLVSWFGIRGIGSIYYLFYALSHGLVGTSSEVAVNLTLSVIALSILVHGLSTQPMLVWYERQAAQKN